MAMEASDFNANRIEIEPRWLLCANCVRGGGMAEYIDKYNIMEIARKISENPELHLTLTGAFDETGARTDKFDKQTPAERRKDLDVLQRLGLCFGDTRSARDLFYRLTNEITSLSGICAYPDNPYGKWPECEIAGDGFYAAGNKLLRPAQDPAQMEARKQSSCRMIAETDRIVVRIHHLLCIACFAGGDDRSPLKEDNLYEVWMKFKDNPDIPVTLVEGPGDCCICPPCHSFIPGRGVCVAGCHLRDRKKDLDTFVALGLSPGDTLSARELYDRIRERIPRAGIICGYDKDTSYEWSSCGGTKSGRYEKSLAGDNFPR